MEKKLSKYEQKVMSYFQKKAEEYDDVENQKYWRLSDKLLWRLLREQLDKLEENFTFLDAGGGTGRWSKKILDEYPHSKGVLVDLSDDMLFQAKKKNNYKGRWKIIKGDLQDLNNLGEKDFDLAIALYNVIGFVENPNKVVNEVVKILKRKGIFISVVPNIYHGTFFNIFQKNMNGAKTLIKTGKGKFVDNMPEIEMFSPKSIKEIYQNNNLKNVFCWGFPISIYPGYQETQLHGESEQAKDILSENFDKIYEIENLIVRDEETASRGNNLFVMGFKL